MFEKILIEQNQHWKGIKQDTGVPREQLKRISLFLPNKQILTVTGIRRCGKSTLLKQLQAQLIAEHKTPENILHLNLENPYFDEFKEEAVSLEKIFDDYISLTEARGRKYVFLDEVQFFKKWQIFVKSKYESEGIKFVLTGSNSWLLSSEFTTLLSGRSFSIELFPFSFREFLLAKKIQLKTKIDLASEERKIKKEFKEYCEWGGFPEVVLSNSPEEKRELLLSYYKSIVYQDIIPRFKINNFKGTQELAHYLLSNIGKLFSYNKLSSIIGLSDKTIKEYAHYFEQAYLLFEVGKYSPSIKKQIMNQKKTYAGDIGLSMAQGFRFSPDRGRILENVVFLHLKSEKKEVYYYKEKRECDFIVKEGRGIISAIQVSQELNDENREREIAGLVEALDMYGLKEGLILTEEQEESFKRGKFKIIVKPLWKYLLD